MWAAAGRQIKDGLRPCLPRQGRGHPKTTQGRQYHCNLQEHLKLTSISKLHKNQETIALF